MRSRCSNPKEKFYSRYGGRGISVCGRWQESFENFLSDMGPRPPGMTLERKNNDGNYEPTNCIWATQNDQALNTSTVRRLTFEGETLSLRGWALRLGIAWSSLKKRLANGWPLELALTLKPGAACEFNKPHHRLKLTDAQVFEIRASRERGSALARAYGVSEQTISDIRRCRTRQKPSLGLRALALQPEGT
jgi:hypothetical protein